MRKSAFVSVLILTIAGAIFFGCRQKAPAPEKVIAHDLLAQVDSFAALSIRMQTAAGANTPNEKELQTLFLQARSAYKRFEWAAEYFVPATSRFVNGPPVQEVEMGGLQVLEPAGLQIMEAFLFPRYDSSQRTKLIRECQLLRSACDKYSTRFGNIDLLDWQIFDAAKLEMFRIETLGITGFDNPLTMKSMAESAVSLASLQHVLAHYTDNNQAVESLTGKFDMAERYLAGNDNFNAFDRAAFIKDYCNPITIGISGLEARLGIYVIRYNRLLNQDATTLFDTNAFNINAYAPDPSSFMTAEKIALGKTLFADPVLSGTGTRSCQSCHQPDKAFADGLVRNTVIGNLTLLKRNTPTLLNAALQPSLFYDLRVNRLEEQSLRVVQSSEEMHGSLQSSAIRLWQDTTYRRLFSIAFPLKNRTGIDTLEVMNAIGSYVRSLVALNSRFDDYMRGDRTAMNAHEVRGFNLFMGKAKCATCHYMPLFNGTFPPRYVKTEAEVIGVPGSLVKNGIDQDVGRFAILKIPSFKYAFKTPTLRNAARTAPYMHNGVFSSLEQVMDFYNKGGGVGLGIKLDNQTLPFDKLDLDEQERKDIIAFMKSLDSK